jgi:RND family efflux transporter MFP subunit
MISIRGRRRRPPNAGPRVLWRVFALAALAVAPAAWIAGCGGTPPDATEYYCPMHPTYVSDRPGDCPICNMRLEARAKPRAAPHGADSARAGASGVSPDGLAGRAPVTLDARSRALAGIQVAPAARTQLVHSVRTVGTVVPDESRLQHIHVKVGGFVERLYIRTTGQFVRRGEPAFELYSPELVASQDEYLRALQSQRELAQSALPEALEAAQELVRAARRRLEFFDVPAAFIAALEARGTAARTVTIPAHATGYVVSKNVVEGDQVEPAMELYTVADLSRVWVEAQFYENEAHALHVGASARITLPHDPSRQLQGEITFIAPYVQPASRTLMVRFEFANPDLMLRPGMFVDVALDIAAVDAVVVPESALLDTGERHIVFVVLAGHRFEPRQVRPGMRGEGRVQILAGLAAGDSVVVHANFLLDSESRLRGALDAEAKGAPGSHPGGTP